jgi:cytochrome c peroxidase
MECHVLPVLSDLSSVKTLFRERMGVRKMNKSRVWGFHAAILAAAFVATTTGAHEPSKSDVSADATGAIETFNINGHTNTKGAFFESLGTNGRSCSTCHVPDQAMSIAPPQIRQRFEQTRGQDPLFNAVDGANCANARTSSEAAHSLLLSHGLIRIALAVPATAQFTVTAVHDPYGCALVADPASGRMILSTYRRPLPSTNLRFLSTMMWDGRESPAASALNSKATFAANLNADLMQQAKDAVATHAQGVKVPTVAQLNDIIAFEMGLSTAQVYDRYAGDLDARGALGGARNLVGEEYYPGINDVLGADPNGIAFDESSMTLFAAWENGGNPYRDDDKDGRGPFDRREARSDIAAGEVLFNTLSINISAVRGLNDNTALGTPATIKGTCTTCHDAPNVGNHSLPLPLDIGIAHTPRAGLESDPNIEKGIAELDEPDLPVFLVSGCPTPFSGGQPASFYTTDLGKGMITGLCSDLNRVKGPILRGLAARAPYFHNGAAATLLQAVNFYNQRFSMNLTQEQKHQLVAFLNSL